MVSINDWVNAVESRIGEGEKNLMDECGITLPEDDELDSEIEEERELMRRDLYKGLNPDDSDYVFQRINRCFGRVGDNLYRKDDFDKLKQEEREVLLKGAEIAAFHYMEFEEGWSLVG